MIILLLDANKTVNGIITGMFFQFPRDQQPEWIHPFRLTHYLGGAFLGWCPRGFWGLRKEDAHL